MLNYQYVNFNYISTDVNNVLDINNRYCRPCSSREKYKISQLLKFPFPITSILVFNLGSGSISLIHKDIDLDNIYANPDFAFNLPLLNCEMTYMKWYEALDENDTQIFGGPSASAKTPMIKPENSKCIDESNFSYPQIVKVNGWHSIENRSEFESKLISIRFPRIIQLESLNNFIISVSPTAHC